MAVVPKDVLAYRRKRGRGEIMSPETFERIEAGARRRGTRKSPEAVAGAAYWRTAKAKARKANARKRS